MPEYEPLHLFQVRLCMDFKEIVKTLCLETAKMPIEARRCPDQYVGVISQFQSEVDFPERSPVESRPSGIKCVIMILESPHINEFVSCLGPAKGRTGELIREHFKHVIGLNDYIGCGLILMNAVQHQCSLGSPTKFYRDDVFCAAWEDGAKENFISRFNSTFKKHDVIVNCCTKGNMKGHELRRLVQQSIPKDKDKVLRRTHPSSWYSEKNRNSQWKLT
ncbi:MAG: hypothetical protein ACTH5B_10650 [Marinomonas sp.]|uniref:hypothetical protein n=1 Tax=Marinomonas sp. TaxID=1904862 RepID=UPI003F9E1F20